MEEDRRKLRATAKTIGKLLQQAGEKPRDGRESIAQILRMDDGEKAARTAALIIIHAVTQTHQRHERGAAATLRHWEQTIKLGSKLHFLPIIPMALRLAQAIPDSRLDQAIEIARDAAPWVNLQQIGRETQELAPKRRQLAVYHTSPESAALMAHLAIPNDRDWGDPGRITGYRIADYACGTGELLTAAYRHIRELHGRAGGDPSEIHQAVMTESITAMDVLPASTTLAAAALDAIEENPGKGNGTTGAVTMRLGTGDRRRTRGRTAKSDIRMGSLDLIDQKGPGSRTMKPIGRQGEQRRMLVEPASQDLVIMNPPFTRIRKPEDMLLGTPARPATEATQNELEMVRGRMNELRRHTSAGTGNGLAFYFSHLADRMVRPGGTIALLLPGSMLSGGGGNPGRDQDGAKPQGWQVFRDRLSWNYNDITVVTIASYQNAGGAFSDDTTIAEMMITARKMEPGETPQHEACFVTLRRQPRNSRETALIAQAIRENRAIPGETRDGERHLWVDGEDLGTIIMSRLPQGEIWAIARTLRPSIVQAAQELGNGMIQTGRGKPPIWLPMTTFAQIARLGMGEFDIRSILEDAAPGRGDFLILRNHDSARHCALETRTEDEMSIKPERERSWKRLNEMCSRLHINDNTRYNSQPTTACLTPEPTLGGRGWPNAKLHNEQYEKALALWMNSTLGIISHWAMSNRTQNGLGYLSVTQMKKLPVLDVTRLTPQQIELMAQAFDETRNTPMMPANEAWHDPVRQELDRRLLQDILGLPPHAMRRIEKLRNQWCLEPTVMGRKGVTVKRQEEMAQLEKLAREDHWEDIGEVLEAGDPQWDRSQA